MNRVVAGAPAGRFARGVDQIQVVVQHEAELDQPGNHDQQHRQQDGEFDQALPARRANRTDQWKSPQERWPLHMQS